MIENKIIETVAIYIRKSRADETLKDLEKHRITLIEICEKYGWKYKTYQERGTSQSIDKRPQMVQLLKDVEDELYDAVLVIDQDRLSRGEGADSDRVKYTLLSTNTVLCVRDRILDLENDIDETQYTYNAFFAQIEYKMIVKRFKRGKVAGAKMGRWTNGPAPMPYIYNAECKELVIDEEYYKLYRYIIDSYIRDKKSTNEIAYELNRAGKLTRKGNYWTNKTILDILSDQTHLGWIVYGKTKKVKLSANTYKTVYLEQKDWKINKNGLHKAVKTIEEHDQILYRIGESRKLMPHQSRNSRVTTAKTVFGLSGLIKCGVCGYTHCIHYRTDTKGNIPIIRKCTHKDKMGTKCTNSSTNYVPILNEVNKAILQYAANFEVETEKMCRQRKADIEGDINFNVKKLKSAQSALDKVYEAYEEGLYTKDVFLKQKEKREVDIDKLTTEIEVFKSELHRLDVELNDNKISILKSFEDIISDGIIDGESINEVYKTLISRIIYTKDLSGEITLKIEYK